ncbi:TetR family transcriptional regulator [Herbihabitans rhizosphaerae]|uniref:TetR family transcriptional regulator n=1 Tax=Herbihabitans rhizosphaerae TaxID=1872711 RepID=A0A4Q7L634_9PSEU|nr:TetR/AcrR family transcriptional regulator [Herbihabitans rhizosphaerae]RZS44706.1 TetR family transcriptional regulator [Herbihabitans rhizosphaerae]
MPESTPTRDRIVDAAVKLFAERGFRGTSITAIEAEAGLTPGAGGIYHHFKSKQDLLRAGVERQLSRLDALRDMRWLITDLGDLRAELTIGARYILSELDSEAELLRILASEARTGQELLISAVEKIVSNSYTELATWMRSRSDVTLTDAQANAIAALAMGSLLSSRVTATVLGGPAFPVSDEHLIATWVHGTLQLLQNPPTLP